MSAKRVLAISAHPDGVEFTSGGSPARWVSEGWVASLGVCTDGGKGSQVAHLRGLAERMSHCNCEYARQGQGGVTYAEAFKALHPFCDTRC